MINPQDDEIKLATSTCILKWVRSAKIPKSTPNPNTPINT
ncbi:hypothetical protein LGAS_0169 [Lactobacillus gasseri ATCC 33323 = JCM 1131]|uniref:Uncharacterized protein n=1 Tax=Lactobacillus gasseri (strain ATCC 33323 / DSM 20243 / BCRC 14619 / CIP 102991 / JCM 1131 / KCTC 3163 / NCIMB 11718 / NCTC 13722 / AM63) TaxID=324831 RepID=A0A806A464_LACGA|nr:hypothetical protein LGAS_0169 [Lactobacillus gasseri ATCC 33323 = JCM 1131]